VIAAVFDTNVVISGTLAPDGAPGKLLNAILDGFCQPVVTDSIMAEYEEVLSRPKFRFPRAKIHFLLDAIRARAVYAPFMPVRIEGALPDSDDIIFVEAALSLQAPLITGNAKHFPEPVVRGVLILSPAVFLARLRPGAGFPV
jgi:putative PIN family toxin of toxin-antitoxin system